jgi:hypothetical protein
VADTHGDSHHSLPLDEGSLEIFWIRMAVTPHSLIDFFHMTPITHWGFGSLSPCGFHCHSTLRKGWDTVVVVDYISRWLIWLPLTASERADRGQSRVWNATILSDFLIMHDASR